MIIYSYQSRKINSCNILLFSLTPKRCCVMQYRVGRATGNAAEKKQTETEQAAPGRKDTQWTGFLLTTCRNDERGGAGVTSGKDTRMTGVKETGIT